MRHHRDHRQLSRTAAHRRSLLRSLVTALFQHERIETTVAKAKETRRVAERMITYAKRNNLHSRRLVARVVQNEDVAKKLFDTITPWYATREGGYTRILKTRRRLGDAGEMAILELVKSPEQKEKDRQARAAVLEAKTKERERKGKAAEKAEKAAEKAEKAEKPAKAVKAEKPVKAEKAEAPAKAVKAEKAEVVAKAPEKAEKPAKAAAAKPKKAAEPEAKEPKKKAAPKPAEGKKKEEKKRGGGLLDRIRKKKDSKS